MTNWYDNVPAPVDSKAAIDHDYHAEWESLAQDVEDLAEIAGVDISGCESPNEVAALVLAELMKRLVPKGMEWPRYTDGEPVKPGDTVYAKTECGPCASRKAKKVTQLAFADPTCPIVRVEYDYTSGYEPNDTWGFVKVPKMTNGEE